MALSFIAIVNVVCVCVLLVLEQMFLVDVISKCGMSPASSITHRIFVNNVAAPR